MEEAGTAEHPVLHYLAVARAARDFGLETAELDRLALRFRPCQDSLAAFTDAVAAGLLERQPKA